MKKRILAFLLALVMIVGILPMTAFAEASLWNPLTPKSQVSGTYAGEKTFTATRTMLIGENGNLQCMPILNSGSTSYNAMAYCAATATSSNTDVVEVKTKDGHQDIDIGTWSGGTWNGADCLRINVNAKKAGTATVTANFYYTFSQSSNPFTNSNAKWFYATMTFTVSVIDPTETTPSKPTASDLSAFWSTVDGEMIALRMNCSTASHTTLYEKPITRKGGVHLGNVTVNDGTHGITNTTKYPWICPMVVKSSEWLAAWNEEYAAQDGTHYLADGQAEEQTVYWFYNMEESKWQYKSADVPVVINITHENPEQITLSFDGNHSAGVTGVPSPISQSKNADGANTFNIPTTAPTCSCGSHHVFKGWTKAVTPGTDDTVYQTGDTISISASTTLYAQWGEHTHVDTNPADGKCDICGECQHEKEDGYCTVEGCDHDGTCCPKPVDPPAGTGPVWKDEYVTDDLVEDAAKFDILCTTDSGHDSSVAVTYTNVSTLCDVSAAVVESLGRWRFDLTLKNKAAQYPTNHVQDTDETDLALRIWIRLNDDGHGYVVDGAESGKIHVKCEETTEKLPVYVYFKAVDADSTNYSDAKNYISLSDSDLQRLNLKYNSATKDYFTLGSIATAQTLTEASYASDSTQFQAVVAELNDSTKFTAHKNNTSFTLKNEITFFNMKRLSTHYGYPKGDAYHLDGYMKFYTVTVDANAGSDTVQNLPTAGYYYDGEVMTLTTPVRDGYSFKGWTVNTETSLYNGTTKTIQSDVALVANWEEDEYTITYDYRDIDATSTNPTSYTIESETITLVPATNGSFGKQFLEWRDAEGDVVTQIAKGSHGDITLYAYWKFPVNYHVLDAEGNEIAEYASTDYFAEDTYASHTLKTVEKTGYTFDGWYEAKEDLGNTSKLVSALGANKKYELYGTLTPNDYTVTFNANGGDAVTPATKTVTFDAAYGELPAATRTGYQFDGWYTAAQGGTKVTAVTIVKTASAHTLYAHWTANSYSVKFLPNDGEGTMSNQSFTYDQAQKLKKNAFTRTGYEFVGWKNGQTTYTDEQEVINLTATHNGVVELTAQWKPLDYTVTFHGNEGYLTEDPTKTETKVTFTWDKEDALLGSVFTKDVKAADSATICSWKLVGWATQDGKVVYTLGQKVKNIIDIDNTRNLDLYAVWEKVDHDMEVSQIKDNDCHHKWSCQNEGCKYNYLEKHKFVEKRALYKAPTKTSYGYRVYDCEICGYRYFDILQATSRVQKVTPKVSFNTTEHIAYINGYKDGTVKPNGEITRAEVSAILYRIMDSKSISKYYTTKCDFADVEAGKWYTTYIATLDNAGIITDSRNGYFRPNEAITRAELAVMLAKFANVTNVEMASFSDVSSRHWAAEEIAIVEYMGWINGYKDGTFHPDATITRAEMMTMINRALNRGVSEDGLIGGYKDWSDNVKGKWYYYEVLEASNGHDYKGTRPNESWTALN